LPRCDPGQAAGLLADGSEELSTAERVGRLQDALRTREVIAQAQGILMGRDRSAADDAAATLRRSSRQADIPLRAIAADIIAAAGPSADLSTDD
jgi:AmiR/NasT family two-component response regulator